MAGTALGGKKAAKTNKERHGDDFYNKIGSKGGRAGHRGGFAANPKLARKAGQKGGLLSRVDVKVRNKLTLAKDDIMDRYLNKLESGETIGKCYGVSGGTIRYYVHKWEKEGKK